MKNYPFLVDTREETLTGLFYKTRPTHENENAVRFKYKQLDPNSKVFSTFWGQIRADAANYAIKTNDACGFNIGGYIVTQNGEFWEITEVITNEEEKTTKNALRWFKRSNNAEISVRMVKISDLYTIESTYLTDCTVTIALFINGVEQPIQSATTTNGKIATQGTNEAVLTIEKNGAATVRLSYLGGSYTLPVKHYNTQKQTNYIEVDL